MSKSKIVEEILNRKGARRPADVPENVLELLQKGEIETVNLSEWLAVDQRILFDYLSDQFKLPKQTVLQVNQVLDEEKKPTSNTLSRLIGQSLEHWADNSEDIRHLLTKSPSDIARCWAAHMIGARKLPIQEKLDAIKEYAADHHFGVREISFVSVKKDIAAYVDESLTHLTPWTKDEDPNVRRFAAEATRPIGVWTNKIDQLKQEPEKALSLLNPLKSDPSKYVQDAVANWLNDASKSRPDFVKELCNNWSKESDSKATAYIVKRAMRTINKNEN